MPAFQIANLTAPDAITEGLVATLIMWPPPIIPPPIIPPVSERTT